MESTYSYNNASEPDLIRQGLSGNTAPTGELFERHYKSALRLARGILRTEAEAEDAVQSAYCSAFEHLSSFRGDASFKTWIHRIVVNRCLATACQPWRRTAINTSLYLTTARLEDFAAPTPSPEKSAWWSQVAIAHERAIAQLAAPMRKAYLLYAHAEMPLAQIAAALGLILAAAKSRIFRARNAVHLSIEQMWSTDGNRG